MTAQQTLAQHVVIPVVLLVVKLSQPENVPSVQQILSWTVVLVLPVILATSQLLEQLHAVNVVIPIVMFVLALLLAPVPPAQPIITCLTVSAHLVLLVGTQLLAQLDATSVVIPIVMFVLVLLLAPVPLVQQIIT
jgi:hypothetical protein